MLKELSVRNFFKSIGKNYFFPVAPVFSGIGLSWLEQTIIIVDSTQIGNYRGVM